MKIVAHFHLAYTLIAWSRSNLQAHCPDFHLEYMEENVTAKKAEPDFNKENGFFLLRLSEEDVGLGDNPVTYQGKTFQPKEEVHITIFGSRLSEELTEAMEEDSSLRRRLQAAIKEREWTYELHNEWYHVVDGEEETIIRMARVPSLPEFYRRINRMAGVEIPERPTHVTLYTYNSDGGIGIATEEQFRQLVVGELSPEYLEE